MQDLALPENTTPWLCGLEKKRKGAGKLPAPLPLIPWLSPEKGPAHCGPFSMLISPFLLVGHGPGGGQGQRERAQHDLIALAVYLYGVPGVELTL